MRFWIVFILLFVPFLREKGQNGDVKIVEVTAPKHPVDSIYVTKVLPVITVDACLKDLLIAVAGKPSAKGTVSDEFFYSLNFVNTEKQKYLGIFADHRHDAQEVDFIAVIELNKKVFLCKGDINTSSLFHKTSMLSRPIKLSMPKKRLTPLWPMEPVLQGWFSFCGSPIDVEVFTTNPVKGYKMEITKNGSRVDIRKASIPLKNVK